MIHRRIGAIALVGAAAAAVVGAALISSPMAYATDPPPDVSPPGIEGTPTNVEDSQIPYLYNLVQENIPYTIFDQANHVVGTYDVHETGGFVGLIPVLALFNTSDVVTDSTGAAPAVGTEYDGTALATVLAGFPQELVGNSFMSSPDGTLADGFFIPFAGFGNYFSIGPTGLLDELSAFGTLVPIIDIPT